MRRPRPLCPDPVSLLVLVLALLWFLAFLFWSPAAHAGGAGGAATGGATEWTQMANHAELVMGVGQQAQQVANQIRQITQAIEEKILLIQDLKKLPIALVAAAVAPFKDDLKAYASLYKSVTDIRRASNEAVGMLDRRSREMRHMNLDPRAYLQQEIALAQSRGGQFSAEFERDMQRLANFNAKSQALEVATRNAGNASGTVEGLQALATQNAIAGAATIELAQVITEQKVAVAAKSREEQARMALAGERALQELQAREAQAAADAAAATQFQLTQPRWWQW